MNEIVNMVIAAYAGCMATAITIWVVMKARNATGVPRPNDATPNKTVCPSCGSKKIKSLVNEPGKMWCVKCGNNFSNEPEQQEQVIEQPTPKPVPVIVKHQCQYCDKMMSTEDALKRHMVKLHLDKITV